jgi:hypothetical protein
MLCSLTPLGEVSEVFYLLRQIFNRNVIDAADPAIRKQAFLDVEGVAAALV